MHVDAALVKKYRHLQPELRAKLQLPEGIAIAGNLMRQLKLTDPHDLEVVEWRAVSDEYVLRFKMLPDGNKVR